VRPSPLHHQSRTRAVAVIRIRPAGAVQEVVVGNPSLSGRPYATNMRVYWRGRSYRGRKSAARPCVDRRNPRAILHVYQSRDAEAADAFGPLGRLRSKEKEALRLMHF
jgi:hypothetical protein